MGSRGGMRMTAAVVRGWRFVPHTSESGFRLWPLFADGVYVSVTELCLTPADVIGPGLDGKGRVIMHVASIVSRLIRRRLGLLVPVALVGGMLLPVATAPAAHASGVPYSVGDVFAAIGNGKIKHFSSTGTLLDTLDSGTGSSENTGMAFDLAGNLYSTQFAANTAVKFDDHGNLLGTFGGGYNAQPESIVRDSAGD